MTSEITYQSHDLPNHYLPKIILEKQQIKRHSLFCKYNIHLIYIFPILNIFVKIMDI